MASYWQFGSLTKLLIWGIAVLGGCGGGLAPHLFSYAATAATIVRAERQAGDTAPPARAPVSSEARKQSVQELFCKRCQKCHGNDGRGEDMRGAVSQLPDFTDAEWHRKRNDKQLLVSILDGKGREMPAFHAKLSKQEARELVVHIRQFGSKADSSQQKDEAADDFEKRFEKLQRELEELKKQFRKLEKGRKPVE